MPRKGRTRFVETAAVYTLDPEALGATKEFLQFKLTVVDHAREEILMTLNRAVTTYQQVTDSTTGAPTGISRETQSLVELNRLRMWLDLLLFELVGVEDALLQAVNVAFNFNRSPKDTTLRQKLHDAIRDHLQVTLKHPTPTCETTGLHKWHEPWKYGVSWLEPLRELRRQATHRHLVKMRESKAWEEQNVAAPLAPAKLRSEFYVDLGNGQEEPLDLFVALSVDRVRDLLNSSCERLAGVLDSLIYHHGGPVAASLRQKWHALNPGKSCSHPTVDRSRDRDGEFLDRDGSMIYFCTDCGTRVLDPVGRKTPDGATYWSA